MDAAVPAMDAGAATPTNAAPAPEAGAIANVDAHAPMDSASQALEADEAIPANASPAPDAEIVDTEANTQKVQVLNTRGIKRRGRGSLGGKARG